MNFNEDRSSAPIEDVDNQDDRAIALACTASMNERVAQESVGTDVCTSSISFNTNKVLNNYNNNINNNNRRDYNIAKFDYILERRELIFPDEISSSGKIDRLSQPKTTTSSSTNIHDDIINEKKRRRGCDDNDILALHHARNIKGVPSFISGTFPSSIDIKNETKNGTSSITTTTTYDNGKIEIKDHKTLSTTDEQQILPQQKHQDDILFTKLKSTGQEKLDETIATQTYECWEECSMNSGISCNSSASMDLRRGSKCIQHFTGASSPSELIATCNTATVASPTENGLNSLTVAALSDPTVVVLCTPVMDCSEKRKSDADNALFVISTAHEAKPHVSPTPEQFISRLLSFLLSAMFKIPTQRSTAATTPSSARAIAPSSSPTRSTHPLTTSIRRDDDEDVYGRCNQYHDNLILVEHILMDIYRACSSWFDKDRRRQHREAMILVQQRLHVKNISDEINESIDKDMSTATTTTGLEIIVHVIKKCLPSNSETNDNFYSYNEKMVQVAACRALTSCIVGILQHHRSSSGTDTTYKRQEQGEKVNQRQQEQKEQEQQYQHQNTKTITKILPNHVDSNSCHAGNKQSLFASFLDSCGVSVFVDMYQTILRLSNCYPDDVLTQLSSSQFFANATPMLLLLPDYFSTSCSSLHVPATSPLSTLTTSLAKHTSSRTIRNPNDSSKTATSTTTIAMDKSNEIYEGNANIGTDTRELYAHAFQNDLQQQQDYLFLEGLKCMVRAVKRFPSILEMQRIGCLYVANVVSSDIDRIECKDISNNSGKICSGNIITILQNHIVLRPRDNVEAVNTPFAVVLANCGYMASSDSANKPLKDENTKTISVEDHTTSTTTSGVLAESIESPSSSSSFPLLLSLFASMLNAVIESTNRFPTSRSLQYCVCSVLSRLLFPTQDTEKSKPNKMIIASSHTDILPSSLIPARTMKFIFGTDTSTSAAELSTKSNMTGTKPQEISPSTNTFIIIDKIAVQDFLIVAMCNFPNEDHIQQTGTDLLQRMKNLAPSIV